MDVLWTRTASETDSHKKWAVCSFEDTISLYFFLLRKTPDKEELARGRRGYYLCSPGLVAREDMYTAIAGALHRKGIIDSLELTLADDTILEKMGPALGVEGKSPVMGTIGGVYVSQYHWCIGLPADRLTRSTYTPEHAMETERKPKHAPEHILETAVADAEVEAILSLVNDDLTKIRWEYMVGFRDAWTKVRAFSSYGKRSSSIETGQKPVLLNTHSRQD
jgi:hypothetical protein